MIKVHRANRKRINGFLSDLFWIQHCICFIIEIFDEKILWTRSIGRFEIIQGQRSWCHSIAHGLFSIGLLLTPSSYLSRFLCISQCVSLSHETSWMLYRSQSSTDLHQTCHQGRVSGVVVTYVLVEIRNSHVGQIGNGINFHHCFYGK